MCWRAVKIKKQNKKTSTEDEQVHKDDNSADNSSSHTTVDNIITLTLSSDNESEVDEEMVISINLTLNKTEKLKKKQYKSFYDTFGIGLILRKYQSRGTSRKSAWSFQEYTNRIKRVCTILPYS
jgi:hypothetical protein